MSNNMATSQTPAATPSPLASTSNNAVAANRPERKIPRLTKPNELVTLYAGNSQQKFVIHKEFAVHYSLVLKTAFNSDFIEGQTQTYRLEDTTERAIRLLIHWMYTQTLDTVEFEDRKFKKTNPNSQAILDQDKSLVELWVLAEKLLIPRLQNLVVREIETIQIKSKQIAIQCFQYVYNSTPEGSPLRRLLVDQCAGHLEATIYEAKLPVFPQEMLMDLVAVMAKAIPLTTKAELQPGKDITKYEVDENGYS